MVSIIILIFLLGFSALMSASETALFSLSSFTIKSYSTDLDNRKKLISHLLSKPRDLLVTILILNILANVLIQNTVSSIFGSYASWLLKVGVPLLLTLFLGEIIPKSIAITNNKAISYRVSPFIAIVEKVLGPIREVMTAITSLISRFIFFFLKKEDPLSTDELYHIIDTSKKTGVLNVDETELASGYLDLQQYSVKEIMRPKDEIIFYDIDKPLSGLIDLFVYKKCSRLPVCKGGIEKVIGIISVTSFFINQPKLIDSESVLKILNKPFYVPETIKGWDLLNKLRECNEQLAIVVDEYGSVVGLVTQADLMETVVGEIEDIRDAKQLYIRPSSDVIIADGKMEIIDIEDVFDLKIEKKTSVVTIGGWLTDQMEKIPSPGEKYVTADLLFYVLEADPTKVKKVYIRRKKNE